MYTEACAERERERERGGGLKCGKSLDLRKEKQTLKRVEQRQERETEK